MVESLLALRLSTLNEAFAGSRSVAQIPAVWERLRLQFVLLHGAAIDTQQLKNKYQALKKEYAAIVNATNATGNRTDAPIAFPTYWPVLTHYMGDERGLGSVDFAQTAHTESTTKRKAEVDAEIQRQREQRCKTEKVDIGQGLVLLSENLASALEHGKETASSATLDAIAQQQTTIMETMEQNQRQLIAHMEGANAVNAALLAFMTKSD